MLTYIIGDLFRSPAKVLVNTVNTVGVMGKGIAKDFKSIYPEMFKEYQKFCEQKKIDIGKLHLFRGSHKWVLNFPTKKDWKHPSRPEYIEAGLDAFVKGYARNTITSIAFPQLGCGNGELNWETVVKPMMERYLVDLPIEVFVHLYDRTSSPEHHNIKETKEWLRAEPESLGFKEVWQDLLELLSSRQQLRSIADKCFNVEVVDCPETGLKISNGDSFFVPQSALLDAWQYLRSEGYIAADGLTYGVESKANEIFAILAELPYLKLTRVARKHSGETEQFTVGLQLVPRALKKSDFALLRPQTVKS